MTIFKGISSYPQKVFDQKLPPSPAGLINGKYDVYCEHSIYNEGYLLTKLHTDTVNVAIIRKPMSHLRSAFNHYHLPKKLGLMTSLDAVAEFLEAPTFFCSHYSSKAYEVTHNRVAREFGYIPSVHEIREYLSYIETKFLVLVFERLPESLVVMRRKLCWGMRDILYSHAREAHYTVPQTNAALVTMHKAWSPLDYEFYEHFRNVMEQTIGAQDADFHEEVTLLEQYQAQTKNFCDNVCSQMETLVTINASRESMASVLNNKTMYAASKWDSWFVMTGLDCLMMRFDPNIFRNIQKVRLFPDYCLHQNEVLQKLSIRSK